MCLCPETVCLCVQVAILSTPSSNVARSNHTPNAQPTHTTAHTTAHTIQNNPTSAVVDDPMCAKQQCGKQQSHAQRPARARKPNAHTTAHTTQNNPTSAVVDDAFWRRALEFCEKHDLLLINDNPYIAQASSQSAQYCSVLLVLPSPVMQLAVCLVTCTDCAFAETQPTHS